MEVVTQHHMVGYRNAGADRYNEVKAAVFAVNYQNSTSMVAKHNNKILINNIVLYYMVMITTWGPGMSVNILGMIVNVFNIITFLRQGVDSSVNTSLLALTISDLGALVFTFLVSLCWVPDILKLDLPFYPGDMKYFLFYFHIIFTRVSTATTAWIAMERCLCIVAPLKVKTLITTRRTIIFIVSQYFIWIATCLPWYYTTRLKWKFDPARNKTMYKLIKIANKDQIEGVVFMINNVLPLMFYVLIVACTVVLSNALLKNAKWRKSATTQKDMPDRDTKVVKLVFIISIVFIVCYAPGSLFYVVLLNDPAVKIGGKQINLTIAFFGLQLLLENINATANFFIYIKMSSKFNATFRRLLCFQGVTNE